MVAQIPFVTGGSLTGFLLRSSVVRDFPGIEVQAFEAPGFIGNNRSKAYNAQYRVELLKVKRLSKQYNYVYFQWTSNTSSNQGT